MAIKPFYVLPVSGKESKSWLPKKPKEIHNGQSDYVSFKASGKADIDYRRAACYAALGGSYSEYNIHCRPRNKSENQYKNRIELEDAFNFFNILTNYEILPEGIQLWEEKDGVHCYIPKGLTFNSLTYVALTCYRWVDSHPPLVWQFLRIMEQEIKRHPLQILPVLIDLYIGNSNHSFIITPGYGAKEGLETATNPLLGLAAKIYFDQKDKRGMKEFKSRYHSVNIAIAKICREISPAVIISRRERWGSYSEKVPKYQLKKAVHGLHPELTKLYQIPNITKQQIQEILADLFTEQSQ